MLEGFAVELESLIVQHEDGLQERIESVFDSNYGTVQVNQECQTEIRNAISRNLDLQIIHDKPFNFQSTRPPSLDVEVQTDVTQTIVDFIASGAQKYEQIHVLGLIQAIDVRKQHVNEEPVENYIE